jgi:hypothetical protein
MGPRNNDDNIALAPEALTRADYTRDVYTWSQEQGRLIREGRWDEIDRDNVAEEIESVGRTEFSRLESALRVLMLHMLKWDHQPEMRSRSWSLSINEQRLRLDDVLADNPGLRPRINEAVLRDYHRARVRALMETGLGPETFPEACPYSFEDITARTFSL